MTKKLQLFLVTLLLPFTAFAELTEQQAQYAWRATISPGESNLRKIALSAEQLQGAIRNDLGDVAVLDTNGVAVPMLVRKVTPDNEKMQIPLEFSPFNTVAKNRAQTVTATEQITTDSGISTRKTTETVSVPEARTDYVVELTEEQRSLAIDKMVLQWRGLASNQLLKIRIESVERFDQFGSGSVRTVTMAQNESTQEWQTLNELPLLLGLHRISVQNPPPDLRLLNVSGVYHSRGKVAPLWNEPTLMQRDSLNDSTYNFAISSNRSAAYFRFQPATPSTVLRGDVYASNRGSQQKRKLFADIQQHNLTPNAQIKASQYLSLPYSPYEEWWFSSKHPIDQAPLLQVGFEPWEVVFFANGTEPYTLFWGNKDATPARNTLADLLADPKQIETAETVSLNESQVAGGLTRIESSRKQWLSWLLWLVLGIAVALTARMAFSLFRDMNKGEKN